MLNQQNFVLVMPNNQPVKFISIYHVLHIFGN